MKIPHKFGHIRVNFLQSVRLQVTYAYETTMSIYIHTHRHMHTHIYVMWNHSNQQCDQEHWYIHFTLLTYDPEQGVKELSLWYGAIRIAIRKYFFITLC